MNVDIRAQRETYVRAWLLVRVENNVRVAVEKLAMKVLLPVGHLRVRLVQPINILSVCCASVLQTT